MRNEVAPYRRAASMARPGRRNVVRDWRLRTFSNANSKFSSCDRPVGRAGVGAGACRAGAHCADGCDPATGKPSVLNPEGDLPVCNGFQEVPPPSTRRQSELLPPAGSGPVVYYMAVCFPKQGNAAARRRADLPVLHAVARSRSACPRRTCGSLTTRRRSRRSSATTSGSGRRTSSTI